jgi:hypothetical protein
MRKFGLVVLAAVGLTAVFGISLFYPVIDAYNAATSDAVEASLPADGSRWEVKRSFFLAADEEALEFGLPPLIHDEPDVLDSLITEDRVIYLEAGDVVEVTGTYHPPNGIAISRVRYAGKDWFCPSLYFGVIHARQINHAVSAIETPSTVRPLNSNSS